MKEQIEKQAIEEMRELIHAEIKKAVDSGLITWTEFAQYLTEHLTEQGYRKQKEGEWIDKRTGAYSRMQSWCSACGKHSGIGGIESNRHKPFCPNCGAKMKGGAG